MKQIIAFILTLLFIDGCSSDTTQQKIAASSIDEVAKHNEVERYRELVNKYMDKPVPYTEFEVIGRPETLEGTSNVYWIAYFPKANFTIVSDKKTDIVKTVYIGKKTN